VVNRRLEKRIFSEIAIEYPEIFNSVFGEWTYEGNCPGEIYIGYENEKYTGFLSGFPISLNTWYLQRAGFVKNQQAKFTNIHRTLFCLDEIHKNFMAILTLIRNDDIKALKITLSVGFKIIGTRIDTEKHLWVEMIHLRQED
jgi:hypothetical protein